MTMATPQAFHPGFPEAGATSAAIEALRRSARSRFEDLGFPTRKHEEWRFTPLSTLVGTAFGPAAPAAIDIEPWLVPDCRRLVFLNGRFDATLSDLGDTSDGVSISTLTQGRVDHAAIVDTHLGAYADIEDEAFAALNTAQDLEGAFVHLGRGASPTAPLHIIYASTGANSVTYPRTLVVAEDESAAAIIESYVGDDVTLTCPVTEIAAGPGAKIRHTRLQEVSSAAFHLGALAVSLARRSNYSLSSVSLGGRLSRLGVRVGLVGEGAHAALDGLTVVDDRRIGDHHVRVDHAVPNCTSAQRFRSVLSDRSRTVFTGRIVVAEAAQKTDANQSSRSLVLSPDAVAFNNPQLEIYADDVRCTHGSTVGQLDDEALFYLQARGIGKEHGKQILTHAFAAEVLDGIEVGDVRNRLERDSRLSARPSAGPNNDRPPDLRRREHPGSVSRSASGGARATAGLPGQRGNDSETEGRHRRRAWLL